MHSIKKIYIYIRSENCISKFTNIYEEEVIFPITNIKKINNMDNKIWLTMWSYWKLLISGKSSEYWYCIFLVSINMLEHQFKPWDAKNHVFKCKNKELHEKKKSIFYLDRIWLLLRDQQLDTVPYFSHS